MPDETMQGLTPGAPLKTSFGLALFLLLGGVISAAQLGKAFVAMPLLQAEMNLGIAVVSFIIATFATLGATLRLGTGLILRRIGARRSLVGGMLVMAAGGLLGAFSRECTLFDFSSDAVEDQDVHSRPAALDSRAITVGTHNLRL